MARKLWAFTSDLRAEGDALFVGLQGDLGNVYRDELQELLERVIVEERHRAVVLDLTEVTYLASFAVAAIGYYFKVASDRGVVFALVLASEQQAKPFRLAGLLEVVPAFGTVEEARTALNAQGIDI